MKYLLADFQQIAVQQVFCSLRNFDEFCVKFRDMFIKIGKNNNEFDKN